MRRSASASVVPFSQQITVRLNFGAEQLLKTAMALSARQAEISHGLLQGGIEDLSLLARVRSPEGLFQAQADIARRQSERSVAALQEMAAALTRSLGETAQFVWRISSWH